MTDEYLIANSHTYSVWLTAVVCDVMMGCVTKQKDEVYLNLVLEFVPETVYRVARHYSKNKQVILPIYIKVCSVTVPCCHAQVVVMLINLAVVMV